MPMGCCLLGGGVLAGYHVGLYLCKIDSLTVARSLAARFVLLSLMDGVTPIHAPPLHRATQPGHSLVGKVPCVDQRPEEVVHSKSASSFRPF